MTVKEYGKYSAWFCDIQYIASQFYFNLLAPELFFLILAQPVYKM